LKQRLPSNEGLKGVASEETQQRTEEAPILAKATYNWMANINWYNFRF
jgi:hypothetical protein